VAHTSGGGGPARPHTHSVLIVRDQFTRRIISFGVHSGGVDGVVLCCRFNRAMSRMESPRHLRSDHDPLFLHYRWQANLRILDIQEVKTLPYVPLSPRLWNV
jgi:putative transposase